MSVFAVCIAAQSTASLSGTVSDEAGLVIAGATVKIADASRSFERTTVSSSGDFYTFPLLTAGNYALTATKNGFGEFTKKDLTLNVGDQKSLQVQMCVGNVNEFRGSVFNYFRNEAIDANDWFENKAGKNRRPLRQNNSGGSFGGKIKCRVSQARTPLKCEIQTIFL